MGLIQSVFCSMTFCVERVLTWTCCAFVLMLLMFTVIILMIYGISVGYHYAQKELAAFAMSSRSTTEEAMLRVGPDTRAVVRLVAVNRSEVEHAPQPILELYKTKKPGEHVYLETSETPIVVLETERSTEKALNSYLLGHNNAIFLRSLTIEGNFRKQLNVHEKPPKEPEFLPHEKEIARRLIGRFRRSRGNITSTIIPFLRPLKTTSHSSANYNLTDPVAVHHRLATV